MISDVPSVARTLAYAVIGRVQSVAACLANRGRRVPREYLKYDVSKLLRAHCLAERLRDGDDVLDVGCGAGQLFRDLGLFRTCGRRVGIDLHTPKVTTSGVEVAAYDGERLPFPNDSFDAVIFAYVLHYLERQHVMRLLAEASRVARRSVFVFEDSLPRWNFWYRVRNRMERLKSDILYGETGQDRYRGSGTEQMYLTCDGWTSLLETVPGVISVEVEPLDRFSALVHHTLFTATLNRISAT